MAGYIQRNPTQPKATWWKRFTDKSILGKKIIYVATQQLGFEICGYPQEFKPRTLVNGKLIAQEEIEYIEITKTVDDVLVASKAVFLLNKYFQFNADTQLMEEQDIADEDVELIKSDVKDVYQFDKNLYLRSRRFDCSIPDEEQEVPTQPLNGLLIDSSYLSLKTENFATDKVYPKAKDLVFYEGCFWVVEEVRSRFKYEPRKKRILFISLKKIKK